VAEGKLVESAKRLEQLQNRAGTLQKRLEQLEQAADQWGAEYSQMRQIDEKEALEQLRKSIHLELNDLEQKNPGSLNTPPVVNPLPQLPVTPADPFSTVSKSAPFSNSLGMGFVPAGTPGVLFSVWETRVKDFEAFVEATEHDAISENRFGTKAYTLEAGGQWNQVGGSWRDPRFPSKQTGEHPVVCVSYLDAEAFCQWLTKKERASGKIPATASYRLPTDSEWSRAVGGTEFPWGDHWPPRATDGNYFGAEAMVGVLQGYSNDLAKAGFKDSAARTGPVGMFAENPFGLYDMGGNVWEWCSTWYTAELNDEETKKAIPALADDVGGQTYRVLRGASWDLAGRVRLRSSIVGNPGASRLVR
jgi:hypothetical protein